MRFFEHQHKAKQRTFYLFFVFVIAMLLTAGLMAFALSVAIRLFFVERSAKQIIWYHVNPTLFWVLVTFFCLSILLYATRCFFVLSQEGGTKVASLIGATPISQLLKKESPDLSVVAFSRVVAEMSVASRVSPPKLFILEDSSINAMVIGSDTQHVAMVVTRGALERLNKEELQGVVGHEFSHIYHQDIGLSIKLSAVIMALGGFYTLGQELLDSVRNASLYSTNRNNRGDSGGGQVIAFYIATGLILLIGSSIGQLFANLLRSSISREREFLADAASAQYTRNPEGLAKALGKIMAETSKQDKYLSSHNAIGVAHLFISPAYKAFASGLFATHPPLKERIARLYGRT
jgi:Zn-dependent protease with chaperone function